MTIKQTEPESVVFEFNRTKITINIYAPRIVRVWAGKFGEFLRRKDEIPK